MHAQNLAKRRMSARGGLKQDRLSAQRKGDRGGSLTRPQRQLSIGGQAQCLCSARCCLGPPPSAFGAIPRADKLTYTRLSRDLAAAHH